MPSGAAGYIPDGEDSSRQNEISEERNAANKASTGGESEC